MCDSLHGKMQQGGEAQEEEEGRQSNMGPCVCCCPSGYPTLPSSNVVSTLPLTYVITIANTFGFALLSGACVVLLRSSSCESSVF